MGFSCNSTPKKLHGALMNEEIFSKIAQRLHGDKEWNGSSSKFVEFQLVHVWGDHVRIELA